LSWFIIPTGRGGQSERMTLKRKLLVAPALAGILTVGGAAVAEAAPSGQAPAQSTTESNDDGDKTGLWGLLGLAGLAGLAGLKRRDRDAGYDRTGRASNSART
jgi:MYXO-CTERM domain-containing protein